VQLKSKLREATKAEEANLAEITATTEANLAAATKALGGEDPDSPGSPSADVLPTTEAGVDGAMLTTASGPECRSVSEPCGDLEKWEHDKWGAGTGPEDGPPLLVDPPGLTLRQRGLAPTGRARNMLSLQGASGSVCKRAYGPPHVHDFDRVIDRAEDVDMRRSDSKMSNASYASSGARSEGSQASDGSGMSVKNSKKRKKRVMANALDHFPTSLPEAIRRH